MRQLCPGQFVIRNVTCLLALVMSFEALSGILCISKFFLRFSRSLVETSTELIGVDNPVRSNYSQIFIKIDAFKNLANSQEILAKY